MLKRILVGICDPLHTASISSYCRDLAERCSANVTALAITDLVYLRDIGPVGVGAANFARQMIQDRVEHNERAILESCDILARKLDEAKIECRLVKESGNAFQTMVEASRYADLVIVGMQGLFEHGVADEPPDELVHLVESGVRPILAVGPTYRAIRRVLIAYSGSSESAATMRMFASLDLWPAADVKVVHFDRQNADGPALLAAARDYLDDHGIKAELEMVHTSPKSGLLKYANDWNADLIVIGNSRKSLLRRKLFGETALQAIKEAKVPLFLSQ